jgi:hypothetical protein
LTILTFPPNFTVFPNIPCANEILVLVAAGLRARRAYAGRDARTTEKPKISTALSMGRLFFILPTNGKKAKPRSFDSNSGAARRERFFLILGVKGLVRMPTRNYPWNP